MNILKPLNTQEDIILTWQDNPGSDGRTYAKDGSIIRRFYSALMRNGFGSYGHMSVLVPRELGAVEVEDFEITDERVRNQGVGKMILRAAISHLKSEQQEELFSGEVSPSALYARRSVLGETMQFYEHRDPNRVPIAKTFGEALHHAQQAEHHHEQQEKYGQLPLSMEAYGVSLDLTSVDTAGWELPVPYDYDEYMAIISA